MEILFQEHLNLVISKTHAAMEKCGIECLVIESGYPDYYFLDDQPTPFRSNPHFLYYCPDPGPGHVLKIVVGEKKPKLYFHTPFDFWHETSKLNGEFWESCFEIEVIGETQSAMKAALSDSRCAILSPDPKYAIELGATKASQELIDILHWNRSSKTQYEIHCLDAANQLAAKGHKAAREAFFKGKSEYQIFQAYLSGAQIRETELPYGNIVALDKNTAILHYQFPKHESNGKTFLIDAGARFAGYCADVTRTYYQDSVDGRFKKLVELIESQQHEQVSMVQPGQDYVEIHKKAYEGVAIALKEIGILKESVDNAVDNKIPFNFFPHGIGHPLGLQVHDVGGKQQDSSGKTYDQPGDFPYLRALRPIQNNDVLTIEPGLYFIPALLNKLKKENPKSSKMLNWEVINDMIPFGGIRIEDNVVATNSGPKNLTRAYLP